MARLAAEEPLINSTSHAWMALIPGAVVGAAIIVVLAILFSAPAARRSPSESFETAVSVSPSVASLRLDFTHASVLLSQPLETEVQALANDARSALDLLAQNFLPTPK